MNFQIVGQPTVRPHACICQRSDPGPFMDLGINRYGEHFYLCQKCLAEIHRLVAPGLVPAKERDAALEEAKGTRLRVAQLEEELTLARAVGADFERTRDKLEEKTAEHLALQRAYDVLNSPPSAEDTLREAVTRKRKQPAGAR